MASLGRSHLEATQFRARTTLQAQGNINASDLDSFRQSISRAEHAQAGRSRSSSTSLAAGDNGRVSEETLERMWPKDNESVAVGCMDHTVAEKPPCDEEVLSAVTADAIPNSTSVRHTSGLNAGHNSIHDIEQWINDVSIQDKEGYWVFELPGCSNGCNNGCNKEIIQLQLSRHSDGQWQARIGLSEPSQSRQTLVELLERRGVSLIWGSNQQRSVS